MRRLSKPWPPQNVSPDGQAERRFSDAENEYLVDLPNAADRGAFARSQFDRMDKPKLRAVMYGEQRCICAYCERRIEEKHPEPRVDHWRPLALNPDLALHWRNLYLSCPTTGTCDDAKGGRPLKCAAADPDLPWPVDCDYDRHIGFGRRGEIYVRSDTGLAQATRDALRYAVEYEPDERGNARSILNLNHPALVTARKAAIDSERSRMEKDFEDRAATPAERGQRAAALLGQNPFPPFVSIRAAWLQKQLGKGK